MLGYNQLYLNSKSNLCLKEIASLLSNIIKKEPFSIITNNEEPKISEIICNILEEQLSLKQSNTVQTLRLQYLFRKLFNDIIPILNFNNNTNFI